MSKMSKMKSQVWNRISVSVYRTAQARFHLTFRVTSRSFAVTIRTCIKNRAGKVSSHCQFCFHLAFSSCRALPLMWFPYSDASTTYRVVRQDLLCIALSSGHSAREIQPIEEFKILHFLVQKYSELVTILSIATS